MNETKEQDQSRPEAITIDEFCARTSKTDRRVEMLAAFHASERAAGNVKAPEDDYAARYLAFQSQPA